MRSAPAQRVAPLLLALAVGGCPGGAKKAAAPPVLETVEPRVTAWNVATHLVIRGKGFGGEALTEDKAPTLTILRTRDLAGNPTDGPSDGGLVPVTVAAGVESIEVDLYFNDTAPPGLYGFRLTRKDGASGDFPDALALVPPLSAAGLDAPAVCLAAPSPAVGVAGSSFLVIDGVGPSLTLGDGLQPWEPGAFSAALAAQPAGCRQVPFSRASLQLCDRLEAPLPAGAPSKVYTLRAAQPPPADGLAPGTLPLLVDRPLGTLALSPPVRSALDAPVDLVIGGGPAPGPAFPGSPGIHVQSGGSPAATVDGAPLAAAASGCQATAVAGHDWCSTLTLTVPQGFPPGHHALAITTMPGCTSDGSFDLTPRPTIAAVSPPVACLRGQTVLGIEGSGFLEPQVLLGGQALTLALTCPPAMASCSRIAAHLFPFAGPPGTYPLSVVNGSVPPASSEAVPVLVAPGPPTAMIPVPQTVFGGASRPVFVGFTEPATAITGVALAPWGTLAGTAVSFTQGAQGIELVVPAGTPVGVYDVAVTEGGLCTGGAWQPVWVVGDYRVLAEDFAAGLGERTGLEIGWLDLKPATEPPVYPQWQASGGNPGGAASYAFAAGHPTWWFAIATPGGWAGYDLATLAFDLWLASSAGAPVTAPDVRLRGNQSELHHALPAPPGPGWQRVTIRLDDPAGWVRVDGSGSRPATLDDLREGRFAVWIRGLYADGGGETWLDNLAVELHH